MNLVFETKTGSRWKYDTDEKILQRISPTRRKFVGIEVEELTVGRFGSFNGNGQSVTTGEVIDIWLSGTL